jgi:hypothetical protein
LGVKVVYLFERADLFRVGDLFLGVGTILKNLHSSLRGRRVLENAIEIQKERGRVIDRDDQ